MYSESIDLFSSNEDNLKYFLLNNKNDFKNSFNILLKNILKQLSSHLISTDYIFIENNDNSDKIEILYQKNSDIKFNNEFNNEFNKDLGKNIKYNNLQYNEMCKIDFIDFMKQPHLVIKFLNYYLLTNFNIKFSNNEIIYTNQLNIINNFINSSIPYILYYKNKIEEENNYLLKNTFMANMSHEIRTPLNGIVTMGHLLQNTPMNDQQIDYMQIIMQSCSHLLGIVNDILDISKLEAGKITLVENEFSLRSCIEDCFTMMRKKAHEKNLELSIIIDNNVPCFIKTDYNRLKQILINLISNSIKFTEKGGIKIQVSLNNKNDYEKTIIYDNNKNIVRKSSSVNGDKSVLINTVNLSNIKFKVIDTGIGILKEDFSKLFKPFGQIDNSTTKISDGTGLGLIISRRLTQLMGGDLILESSSVDELIHGSTFVFNINVKDTTNKLERSISETLDVALLKGKTCLIIDDNINNRIALSNLLEMYDMNYYLTGSGEEAILSYLNNLKRLKTIDFALIDIRMPLMDGNQVIERIYDMFKEHSIEFPCIAMNSGDDDISDKFNIILTKPIVEKKLIKSLIELSPFNNKKIKKEKSMIIEKIFNTNINILIAEDNLINQKVILNCLLTLGINENNIVIVDDGLKAYNNYINNNNKYDFIFLDMIMPILDGPSTGKKIYDFRINNNLSLNKPKIIGLTALAMNGDREKYMREGHFDDYLYKPIDLDILRSIFTKS